MTLKHFAAILTLALMLACTGKQKAATAVAPAAAEKYAEEAKPMPTKSKTALLLDSLGYENIAERDSSIIIDLMYARADNFVGRVLYNDLREAYLHPVAMKCLLKAQTLLRQCHPGYRLIVYDAARPMSVQQQMWDVVKGTNKNRYVSNPAHGGGLHNYGLAVDISIADSLGNPLSMGTPVDHLGPAAHITNEGTLVASGRITAQDRDNRRLLRSVMKEAGFTPLPSEWWHFNYCSRPEAKKHFKVIP